MEPGQVIAVLERHSGSKIEDLDTPLFEDGIGLDSMSFLQVVLELERDHDLVLRSEDLTDDAISSIGSFVRHVSAEGA